MTRKAGRVLIIKVVTVRCVGRVLFIQLEKCGLRLLVQDRNGLLVLVCNIADT